jgi:hypothetical protein
MVTLLAMLSISNLKHGGSGKMIKMKIKGILYTGKTVYECLCKAVKRPIDIHARMSEVYQIINNQPTRR